MREILFRGRTKDGKWCYGDYVHAIRFNGVRGLHKDWIIPGVYGNGGWVSLRGKDAVGGDTVGQYTGLTDKNGVKIFDGDIVRYNGTVHEVVFESRCGSGYYGIVVSNIETWGFNNSTPASEMEVIGNIYDNPELLEEVIE